MNDERQEILTALRSTWCGLDTEELATALDIHPNAVRWHLGVLRADGLVDAQPEHRHGPRPSTVYRLAGSISRAAVSGARPSPSI